MKTKMFILAVFNFFLNLSFFEAQVSDGTITRAGENTKDLFHTSKVEADLELSRAPNSYIFDIDQPYVGLEIPVTKAYIMWRNNEYLKDTSIPSERISASVYWEDVPGLIKSTEIEQKPVIEESVIKVMVEKSKGEGNALIAFHVGPNGNSSDPVYWSWHVWVTDDPTGGVQYGHPGRNKDLDGNSFTPQFMDRNLGAVSDSLFGEDWPKTGGLMYQWGRKDPFPPLAYKDRGLYEVSGSVDILPVSYDLYYIKYRVSRSSIGNSPYPKDMKENIVFSVHHPFTYIEIPGSPTQEHWFTSQRFADNTTKKNFDLWSDVTQGNSSGDRYPLKSPFDPCPDGWRVPSFSSRDNFAVSSSPWGRQGNSTQLPGGDRIDVISGNPLYDGIKIYPAIGVDFSGVPNQNIGKYSLTGKFLRYSDANGFSTIFQDENSEAYVLSATLEATSLTRNLHVVIDPARRNGPIYGVAHMNSHGSISEAGAIRCIQDPNRGKMRDFTTRYIPAPPGYKDYKEGLRNPNTYIVKEGVIGKKIPVNKAYAVYNQYLTDHGWPVGIQSVNVYWTTNKQLIKSVSLENSGESAKIIVVTTPGQTGNAIISLHIGNHGNSNDPVLWSWQIWAPNGDPEENTFTYVTEDVVPGVTPQIINPTTSGLPPIKSIFMDRNLGAVEAFPIELKTRTTPELLAKASLSGGMHYQWGKKDPVPTFLSDQPVIYVGSTTEGSLNYTPVTSETYNSDYTKEYSYYSNLAGVTSTDKKHEVISKILKYSTSHPLYYLYNTGESLDWISNQNAQASNRWGHGTKKSPFDPCPDGWRIPDFTFVTHLDGTTNKDKGFSPWYNGHNNNGLGYGQGYGYLGSWYRATFVSVNGAVGIVFDGPDYKIGGYIQTGVRGAYRHNPNTIDNYNVRFGLWSSTMYPFGLTYEGENYLGRAFAGVARYSNAGVMFAAAAIDMLSYSALNIRCTKDAVKYGGASPPMSDPETEVEDVIPHVQVAPNPTSGLFKVILNEHSEGTVQIIDLNGRAVFTQSYGHSKEWVINIQNLHSGIYFVKVKSGEGITTKKLIKN